MPGPFSRVDYENFVKAEASYNDATATPVAGDAFRSRTAFPFKRVKSRLDRENDIDGTSSVHGTVGGREKATWEINAALAPSGVIGTPTPPDMFEFFKAHFGLQDIATANGTTAAGSTTTLINASTGGAAAMGLTVGQWLGVDVSVAFGIELRQILTIVGDAITVDRALSAAPAIGRDLIGCVTYRLSRSTMGSVALFNYLSGDSSRKVLPGCVVSDMEVSFDASADVPEAMVKFSGEGAKIIPLLTTKPTGTFTGAPLAPAASYAWIGPDKTCVTSLSLNSNNGLEVRSNESCSLFPTGLKRTGNNGKYSIKLQLELLYMTGTVAGYEDGASTLVEYDVIVQIGNTKGKGFAFRCPKFIPEAERSEVDGEAGLSLDGRAYGTGTADTELSCCFF